MAASVGLNLIVFSFVNALWLRPLPFRDADRLVTVLGGYYAGPASEIYSVAETVAGQVATELDGLELRLRFAQVGGHLEVVGVTPGYFSLFGLSIRGRDFTPADDREGAEPVAIISDRLWSVAFQRRADLIGSVIAGEPVAVRVIGVAPAGFEGARRGERTDVWIPRALVPRVGPVMRQAASLPMIAWARLRPGETPADADRRLKQTRPMQAVVPVHDVFGAPGSRTILIRESGSAGVVAGLAMLVLFGGCASLAALVLVHYERRRSELAVSAALGASRARLVGLLSRELAAVAIWGSAGALFVAWVGLKGVPSLKLPGGVELGRLDLTLDWRVLTVAVVATVLTLGAAACLPILRFTREDLAADLLAGSATTASIGSQRTRQALLALLVCATVVVLIAAGLFGRAVVRGFGSAPGFDVERTVFVSARLTPPAGTAGAAMMQYVSARTRTVRDLLQSIPGVDDVADGTPPIDPAAALRLRAPLSVRVRGGEHQILLGRFAGSPDLQSTLGIPTVVGRVLTNADRAASPLPAVVTESVARKLWPGESPLGEVVSGDWRGGPLIIVGVARDFAYGSLAGPADGAVITPGSDGALGIYPRYVVRVRGESNRVGAEIRRRVSASFADVNRVEVLTGRDIVARDLARQQLGAWLFAGFGGVALIVGVGSIFGLVAYLAESRQREFGVRLALGATSRDLLCVGMATALVPVGIGLATGVIVAAIVSTVFQSLLVGLSSMDALTYVAVVTVILGTATCAALVAAWRLRRVRPSEALRAH